MTPNCSGDSSNDDNNKCNKSTDKTMTEKHSNSKETSTMQIRRAIIAGVVLAGAGLLTPCSVRAVEMAEATDPNDPHMAAEDNANSNGTGNLKIMLNFQEAPLQTVLEYLSETAGLTIVSTEAIFDGRITVISRQPITVDKAVQLINSVLKESDLTAVRMGKTLKVYTLSEAKVAPIPVVRETDPNAVVPGDDLVTYVIPVGHVTASALRENLLALVPEYATLESNDDSNTLIITDTTANIRRLMQIIQALDTHMATVAEIRVFRLINADATSAANLINSIFQQETASSRNRQGRGNIMEMMMGGRGGRGGRGGGDNGGGSGGATGGGSVNVSVVAAADSRTNSVVVRGPSEALSVVAGMIEALDNRTTEVADVRVIQLRYADALNAADVINQLFGQSGSNSRQNQGARAMFQRGGRGGRGGFMQQQQETNGTQLQVTAAADSQTNSVVVTGPANLLDIVEEVVERLDSQIPNPADVKVFHLEYADAENTASLVNEIFGADSTSSSRSSRTGQNRQTQFNRGGRGMQQQTQTSSASDVTVVASADSRTNSVVVTGPPDMMETIGQVIEDLDKNPEQERQIFVYGLKNATASNLMTILNNMFEEMQSLNEQGTGRTGGQQFRGATGGATTQSSSASGNDLSEETYFEADEETNSLLIMTSTKNYEKIKPIIDELDKPVGQVLIKVLFAEITHSNSVDLGTEFSAWNLRGAGETNNLEVGTAFGTPTGGLTASVFDNTLEATVSTLQETGKLNILSRPYILTSNQQEASMTVGNEVPFATGSNTSDTGSTVITTEYRNIGIDLSVTPSINPEGLVILTVSPTISSTTGDSVRVSDQLSLPVFASRTSTTKVAVRDGQTIVIGGLIQDEIRDTVSKVPLLGDLPLLGHAFKRTQKEKVKTELLIFLTPHVAQEALELTPISEAERRRSNLGNDVTIAPIYREHLRGMGSLGNADAEVDVNEPNEP